MRVVHTSDWHLGHELHGFDRGFEHDEFLDWLASQLTKLHTDALIVTGDIYDTVNPSIGAQQRLYRFLSRALAESPSLQIVLIGGNHDSAARLELPKHLLDAHRVHLLGGMPRGDGGPIPARTLIELCDKNGAPRAVCAAVPYLRPGDLPLVTGESPIKALYDKVIEAARAIRRDLPLIVTGHLHMRDAAVCEISERRIIVGGEEAVCADIFAASVAYVALGHLHRPQDVPGKTAIRYAGAPFPMSMAETAYKHSIVVLDFYKSGDMKTELVETPRPVAFYRVPRTDAASLDVIERELRRLQLEDYGENRRPFLEIVVQLDGPEPSLRQRIEAALNGKPVRLTRIVRQTVGQRPTPPCDGDEVLDELEPAHIFTRRYRDEYGNEPPADLRRAFDEVLNSVLAPNTDNTEVA